MTAPWACELNEEIPGELVERAVRLAATPWVTPERVRDAVADCLDRTVLTTADVFDAVERQAGGSRMLASPKQADAAAQSLLRAGSRVLIAGTSGYPARLADAWPELGAPLWVFLLGTGIPERPAAAVVGTRHPTLDGATTARELASLLARTGATVVSGLARGIDQAAHLGALDGGGPTVAVLGTGFGVDYPRRDGPLRDAIAAAGALLSELLPGTPPQKRTFLWRNRIISALADVTVVVEGRSGSGALHTARMAAAQGRDVLAVPGPVRAATSRAPLDLIRDGAQPLTRLDDVLEVLGLKPRAGEPHAAPVAVEGLSDVARALLDLIGAVPAAPNTLAAAASQPIPSVLAAVAELQARSLVVATPRGVVRHIDPPVPVR